MSNIERVREEIKAAREQLESKQVPSESKSESLDLESVVDVSPEVVVDEVVSEEPKYTEVEQKAIEMGWNPNFKGDNKVSAKEFVERDSFFKAIESRNKKIDTLEMSVKELLAHNQKLEKASYEKALKELTRQKKEAIEIGDVNKVNNVEQQIGVMYQQHQEAQKLVVPVSVDPVLLDFKDRNKSWFNYDNFENKEMAELAIFKGNQYGNLPPSEAVAKVEAFIKKAYPHRFESESKSSVPKVMTSSVSSSRASSSEAGFDRLSAQQKAIYKQAKEYGSSLKLSDYIKQLELTGDLRND